MPDLVTKPEADVNAAPADRTNADAQETSSVDSLLSEYDEAVAPAADAATPNADAPSTEAPAGESAASFDPRLEEMHSFMQKQMQRDTQKDIGTAVETIKRHDPLLANLPDSMVRGHLHDLASKDSRFLKAFQNRGDNPKGWENILKSVAVEVTKELGEPVDSELSSNIASLRASVNTSSPSGKSGPTDAEIAGMSDADFDKHVRSLGGSAGPGYVIP